MTRTHHLAGGLKMASALLFVLAFFCGEARATTKSVTICAKITANFTDPGGDFWPTSGVDRAARGIQFRILHDGTQIDGYMNSAGCTTQTVTSANRYYVTVWSNAKVNGIDIESYTEATAGTLTTEAKTFQLDIALSYPTLIIPHHQTWLNLAVGMWAFHRNDMNLGTYSARGCCHNTSHDWYDYDGTCVYDPGEPDPPSGGNKELYGPSWGEYAGDDGTTVEFMNRTYTGAGCCGSHYNGDRPAVIVLTNKKFIIAHELGHVVVMKRMFERTHTDYTAPLKQSPGGTICMGAYKGTYDPANPDDYKSDMDDSDLTDTVDNRGKALITMEYQSGAAREGWAHFYSAWLWNRRTETDCFYNMHGVHDFDLDGDIDNNYVDTGKDYNDHDWDGAINCEGIDVPTDTSDPDHVPVPRGDDVESYATPKDWLEDMYTEGACSVSDLSNRGTQYDWQRYFWDMLTDYTTVDPEDLADVYVDMCPTNWAQNDDAVDHNDETPVKRLQLSTTYHGLSTQHTAEKGNGQDH